MAAIYKRDIEILCEKLKLAGEESVILTASITEGKVTHFGSSVGLLYGKDICSTFLLFCKENYTISDVTVTPERVTRASVSRPVTSGRPKRRRKIPVTYKDNYEDNNDDDDDDDDDTIDDGAVDDDEKDEDFHVKLSSKPSEPEREVKKTPVKKSKQHKQNTCPVKVERKEVKEDAGETVKVKDDSTQNGEEEENTSEFHRDTRSSIKSDNSYKCPHCQTFLDTFLALTRHVKDHATKTSHPCPRCKKCFTRKIELNTHMSCHSKEKARNRDAAVHSSNPTCDMCAQKFKTRDGLIRHKKRVHKVNVITRTLPIPVGRILNVNNGGKRYGCESCDAAFKTRFNLKRHMLTHTDERPYKCDICGRAFRDSDNLSKHIMRHTNEKPFKCDLCLKSFKSKGGLKIHGIIFHGDKGPGKGNAESFKCSICGRTCGSYYSLKSHENCHKNDSKILNKSRELIATEGEQEVPEPINIIEKEDPPFEPVQIQPKAGRPWYTCERCGKKFTALRNYRIHIKNHDSHRESHSCEMCGKEYLSPVALYRHRKLHDRKGTYICKTCGQRYNTMESLRRHAKIHLPEKPYKCDVCQKGFLERRNRDSHYLTHTNEKPFICDQCGKAFRTQKQMSSHAGVHTGEKPYTCNICDATFRLKDTLRNHKIIHSTFKKFMCHTCGKRFHRPVHLRNHQSVHADHPEHMCKHCGKGFKMESSLKTHMVAQHMTEEELASCSFKTHKCEYCGKVFRERHNHDRHIRIHTGEKPYSCEICGKCFADSSNLRTHVRNHKGDKSKACHICEKSFMFTKDLKKHMLTHTGSSSKHTHYHNQDGEERTDHNLNTTMHVHMPIPDSVLVAHSQPPQHVLPAQVASIPVPQPVQPLPLVEAHPVSLASVHLVPQTNPHAATLTPSHTVPHSASMALPVIVSHSGTPSIAQSVPHSAVHSVYSVAHGSHSTHPNNSGLLTISPLSTHAQHLAPPPPHPAHHALPPTPHEQDVYNAAYALNFAQHITPLPPVSVPPMETLLHNTTMANHHQTWHNM